MGKIKIDPEKCKRDGLCIAICCENHVFVQSADSDVPSVVNEEECVACGHCVAICPGDAIVHNGVQMSRFLPVDQSIMPDHTATEVLLTSLRTTRHYKDKPVPEQVIENLLRVGSMAASEHNAQDREFIVVTDRKQISGLSKQIVDYYRRLLFMLRVSVIRMISVFNPGMGAYLERSLPDMRRIVYEYALDNDTIFHGAPCLIVITSSKGNILGKDSALTSQESIRILAHSMGLGTCISGYSIGAFSVVRRALKIPRNRQAQTLFTMGYPKYKFRKTVDRKPPVMIRP